MGCKLCSFKVIGTNWCLAHIVWEHASCASVTSLTLLAVQVEPARCSHYTALCYNSCLTVCLQLGDEVTSTSKLATHVCNMADTLIPADSILRGQYAVYAKITWFQIPGSLPLFAHSFPVGGGSLGTRLYPVRRGGAPRVTWYLTCIANEAVMYAFIRMSIQSYTGLSSTDLSR